MFEWWTRWRTERAQRRRIRKLDKEFTPALVDHVVSTMGGHVANREGRHLAASSLRSLCR